MHSIEVDFEVRKQFSSGFIAFGNTLAAAIIFGIAYRDNKFSIPIALEGFLLLIAIYTFAIIVLMGSRKK